MGFRMRKSFKLAKGVRMNVGKKGLGLSVGTRGLRYSINSSGRRTTTVGLPGTGMSYSKSTGGGGRKRSSSSAYASRQQQKMAEHERNRQLVDDYTQLIEMVTGLHKDCENVVEWSHIREVQPPFQPPQLGPHESRAVAEVENFKPRFYEGWFPLLANKRKAKLEKRIVEGREQDERDYVEWEALHELSVRVLGSDVDAYFQVIDEMNPLEELQEFGSHFEFHSGSEKGMEVEFRVKSGEIIPNFVLSLTQTGKLSRKEMNKTQYYGLVQDYVCSATIRIARDLMAILPLEQVVVHAMDELLNTSTGHMEEQTIVSVRFDRTNMLQLNYDMIDPSDAIQRFPHQMKHQKTAGMKPVNRVTLDDN